jgi:hypothetical protein
MLVRPPRERSVARRQKSQVIEIGAGQAERASLAGQKDPGAVSQFLATFVAGRIAMRDKHLQIGALAGRHSRFTAIVIFRATRHGVTKEKSTCEAKEVTYSTRLLHPTKIIPLLRS